MTPAQELRAAAKAVSVELAPHWRHTPRLVQTDSESIDGIAFCPQPHATSGEHEFSACDSCEVIEVHSDELAALIVSLLAAREPLAAWLREEGKRVAHVARDPRNQEIIADQRALKAARVINGGAS
jgi:hypothetical protein